MAGKTAHRWKIAEDLKPKLMRISCKVGCIKETFTVPWQPPRVLGPVSLAALKMNLQEVGWGMNWIDVAQDRDRWRALVNAVMNLRVP
jgi:hypothetical protein